MTLYAYQTIPIHDCGEPLVELADYNFALEPAYYRAGLAPTPVMMLRQGVAEKLAEVQAGLAPLRFKIWDGWRSRAVQQAIYDRYWADLARRQPGWSETQLRAAVGRFVTPAYEPGRIPPHATGGAVDLTLVDEQGQELAMGTGFDHFGPEAAPHYFEQVRAEADIARCRRVLRQALTGAGFRQDEAEWWHFDYGNQLWAAALGRPAANYGETAPGRTPSP